jgi:hypothetical protein
MVSGGWWLAPTLFGVVVAGTAVHAQEINLQAITRRCGGALLALFTFVGTLFSALSAIFERYPMRLRGAATASGRGYLVILCALATSSIAHADNDTFTQIGSFQIQPVLQGVGPSNIHQWNWPVPGFVSFPQEFGSVPNVVVSVATSQGWPLNVTPANVTPQALRQSFGPSTPVRTKDCIVLFPRP